MDLGDEITDAIFSLLSPALQAVIFAPSGNPVCNEFSFPLPPSFLAMQSAREMRNLPYSTALYTVRVQEKGQKQKGMRDFYRVSLSTRLNAVSWVCSVLFLPEYLCKTESYQTIVSCPPSLKDALRVFGGIIVKKVWHTVIFRPLAMGESLANLIQ